MESGAKRPRGAGCTSARRAYISQTPGVFCIPSPFSPLFGSLGSDCEPRWRAAAWFSTARAWRTLQTTRAESPGKAPFLGRRAPCRGSWHWGGAGGVPTHPGRLFLKQATSCKPTALAAQSLMPLQPSTAPPANQSGGQCCWGSHKSVFLSSPSMPESAGDAWVGWERLSHPTTVAQGRVFKGFIAALLSPRRVSAPLGPLPATLSLPHPAAAPLMQVRHNGGSRCRGGWPPVWCARLRHAAACPAEHCADGTATAQLAAQPPAGTPVHRCPRHPFPSFPPDSTPAPSVYRRRLLQGTTSA